MFKIERDEVTVNVKDSMNPNGGVDVNVQDQSTALVIVKFNQLQSQHQLTVAVSVDDYQITIADTTGIIVGNYISLVNVIGNRYYLGEVTDVVSGTVLQLDTPIDFAYQIGDYVGVRTTDMSVNGTMAAPQKFSLRGLITEEIPLTIDINRIVFTCLTATTVDLSTFGDLAKLTNGLVLRRINGMTENIFNVKNNLELDGITLDWNPYSKDKPNEGQDGFTCRLTFNGQDKLGVTSRLGPNEDLEIIIQDSLSGLTFLGCYAEGHVVE